MQKKGTKKAGIEKPYPVTVSDWIVFLESNASLNINLYGVLFSSLLVLAVALLGFQTTNNIYLGITSILFIAISVAIGGKIKYASNRIKNYQRLSQKIIEGKITEPEKILEEYNKFKKEI